MRNLKLIIQYDGFLFHGFQIQPTARTVQGEIEKMLSHITGEDVHVQGCSRTDAGVHAYMYCLNFHTDFPIPADKLPYVMNNNKITTDIKVLSCEEVSEDFNARFDTKYKTYRYLINTNPNEDVFFRNYQWLYGKPLDIDAMRQGAQHIIGEHDFRSFMTSGTDVSSTVRNVFSLEINTPSENLVEILISADGYLYNMVRIITGTLVSVGEGRISPDKVKDIISSCDRQNAGPTAPPQGLYLYKVVY